MQGLQLTFPQQIFTLFFAIFWGAAANGQTRYKPFGWLGDRASWYRIGLSIVLLNLLPIAYFVLVLWLLRGWVWQLEDWQLTTALKMGGAVVPGFGIFGFYRLWIAVIQKFGSTLYRRLPEGLQRIESAAQTASAQRNVSDLDPALARGNLFSGFLYLFVPLVLLGFTALISSPLPTHTGDIPSPTAVIKTQFHSPNARSPESSISKARIDHGPDDLVTLLAALAGALIGFFGSLMLQTQAAKREQRAAGRAVLAEMFTNLDRALGAESTRVIHQFLDAAWREQLPLVAKLLKWKELKKILSAYDSGDRGYQNAVDVAKRLDDKELELKKTATVMGNELERDKEFALVEQKRRRIDGWFRAMAQDWLEAMSVLRNAAIDCNEREVFDEDFRKLEERVKSADAIAKPG